MSELEIVKLLILTHPECDKRNAKFYHEDFMVHLIHAGWNCRKEVHTPYYVDGKSHIGRIDVIAVKGLDLLLLELDRATPRQRSFLKLRMVDYKEFNVYRYIMCRATGEITRVSVP